MRLRRDKIEDVGKDRGGNVTIYALPARQIARMGRKTLAFFVGCGKMGGCTEICARTALTLRILRLKFRATRGEPQLGAEMAVSRTL
jgi:hypothetical protein